MPATIINFINDVLVETIVGVIIAIVGIVWKIREKRQRKVVHQESSQIFWAPNEKRICFVISSNGKRSAHIHDIEHNIKFNVNVPIADGHDPIWSPQGNKIAFISDIDGNADIFICDTDIFRVQQITFNKEDDVDPKWLDNGNKISYTTIKNGQLIVSVIHLNDLDKN